MFLSEASETSAEASSRANAKKREVSGWGKSARRRGKDGTDAMATVSIAKAVPSCLEKVGGTKKMRLFSIWWKIMVAICILRKNK